MGATTVDVDAELARAVGDERIDATARDSIVVLLRARREHADVSADLDVLAVVRERDNEAIVHAVARALRIRAARYARTLHRAP